MTPVHHAGPADHTRLSRFLDAVLAIGSDLSLNAVLRHIVESACELVDARYLLRELLLQLLGFLVAHGHRGAGGIGNENRGHTKREVQEAPLADLKTQQGLIAGYRIISFVISLQTSLSFYACTS